MVPFFQTFSRVCFAKNQQEEELVNKYMKFFHPIRMKYSICKLLPTKWLIISQLIKNKVIVVINQIVFWMLAVITILLVWNQFIMIMKYIDQNFLDSLMLMQRNLMRRNKSHRLMHLIAQGRMVRDIMQLI